MANDALAVKVTLAQAPYTLIRFDCQFQPRSQAKEAEKRDPGNEIVLVNAGLH